MAKKKEKRITDSLTEEEKLLLLTGKNLWEIHDFNGKVPHFNMADGPHGLRQTYTCNGREITKPATAYPTLSCLANSWDVSVVYKIGECIAEDCIENDVDMILGPGINIKRTPLCGRNFEYFSEDPFLAGNMAAGYVNGVQSRKIASCVKHFCANNREYDRLFLSSEVALRPLHDIYMEAFRICIEKASPMAIMTSYNPVNGINMSENSSCIREGLRKDLKFKGLIVSDWGAVHDRAKALKAGLNLEMPNNPSSYKVLKKAISNGEISTKDIDESVGKICDILERKEKTKDKRVVKYTTEKRQKITIDAACSSMVLLKNEGVLPIKEKKKVCVIGNFDRKPVYGGGGAAKVLSGKPIVRLSDQLKKYLKKTEITPVYPNVVTANLNEIGVDGLRNQPLALDVAKESDTAVIYVGTNDIIESESYDREKIRLSVTLENLINNVSKVNKNTVVILCCGSAVDMSPWIRNVKGVLLAGFAGEGVNEAVAKILVGKVCPSGKLAETYPLKLEDISTYGEYGDGYKEEYKDGIYVGYRYYDKENKDVLFPFGFGLSYTDFVYKNLTIKEDEKGYSVSFDITNVGKADGAEISELYVDKTNSKVERACRELKGFNKTFIKSGKTERVEIYLTATDLRIYDEERKSYFVEGGEYNVMIGKSERDIVLKGKITVKGIQEIK